MSGVASRDNLPGFYPQQSLQQRSHFKRPQKETTSRGQRRQRAIRQSRPKQTKCDGNTKSRRPDTKSHKTVSELNEYRRRRNLNNLMMINRLETNIGRMEAHLQEMGFNLDDDSTAGASPLLTKPESIQQSPSSSFSEFENMINESPSESNSEDVFADFQGLPRTAATPNFNVKPMVSSPCYEEGSSQPEGFTGLFIPRCLSDTPSKRGLQALSREGIEWINEKAEVTPPFPSDNYHTGVRDSLLDGTFPSRSFCPLPPKEEALSLLDEYLQNFNSLCPLFQKSKLLPLFNHDNLDIWFSNPSHWASINVVLALGIMLRIKSHRVVQPDHQKSWLFIKNALGVLNALCMGAPTLWTIQALLGMTVFLLGTSSSEPCSFLISTAIRFSHEIGLERSEIGHALCPEELEQRRRVFWVAYCLDRDISLRFDKPLVQNDDDMSVNLPFGMPIDTNETTPTAEQRAEFDVFRASCQLAVIKGQLYKHLYSTTAKERSLGEIIASVGMLDERLQQWKEHLPSKYQPEAQSLPLFPQSPISVVLLFLHYSYFNCMIAIHRLIASHGISIGLDLSENKGAYAPSIPPPSSRIFMSTALCTSAARSSINLMRYMPEGNTCVVGILIHYPIVALMTLSSAIIRNPQDASRTYDMRLIGQVEKFLSSLVLSIPNEGVKQLVDYCAKYRSAAEAAVQKTMQFCAGY